MFDSVRRHQRIVMAVILLLILPSFVFFGISRFDQSDGKDRVAEVNGRVISNGELDQEVTGLLRNLRDQGIDNMQSNNPLVRSMALNNLVQRGVLEAEVERLRLQPPAAQLREEILKIDGLIKADGGIDYDRYRSWLQERNLTVDRFEGLMAKQMAMASLNGLWGRLVFISDKHRDEIAQQLQQERVVKEKVFRKEDFAAQVKPTDADLKPIYEQDSSSFNTEASADIQYVMLRRDDFVAKEAVTEEAIKARYEAQQAQYTRAAERRVRHILIAFPKDKTSPSNDDIAKARKEAQAVLVELKKKGADFAAIAKKRSQDPGSAGRGGDLGWFGRGAMVPPFEEAAFSLPVGELSQPIQTTFGFHILEVLEKREPEVKPLAEVRDELVKALREEAVSKTYPAKVESFVNLVYEQSGSLDAASAALGVKVLELKDLKQNVAAKVAVDLLNDAKVRDALFSNDALVDKHNIQAVEVSPGNWISARVTAYRPSVKRSFSEVRAEVVGRFVDKESLRLATAAGEAALKVLQGNPADTSVALTERNYNRYMTGDRKFLIPVLSMEAKVLPSVKGHAFEGGYAVLQLVKVVSRPQDVSAENVKSAQDAVVSGYEGEQRAVFSEALRSRYKVSTSNAAASAAVQ